MIAATNGWLVALDNLSRVQTWLSDALCRLSTGGGFATRELYANTEEVLFDAMRPVLLNGIEELATRSGLLDRALVLNLPTIPEDRRRSEADVWGEFEAVRPAVLGALLDAVSAALGRIGGVRLTRLPRMADFALWAVASEPALGLPEGAFLRAYYGNREAANELALDASPVAAAIMELTERERYWSGTAAELLAELNLIASEDVQRQKGWPKSAQGMGGAVKRLAPNLRAAGINVISGPGAREGGSGRRLIKIEKTRVPSSQTSQASQAQINGASDRDEHETGFISGQDLSHGLSQENAGQMAGRDDRDECDEAGGGDSTLNDEINELAARLEYDEHLPREEAEARARAFYAPPTS